MTEQENLEVVEAEDTESPEALRQRAIDAVNAIPQDEERKPAETIDEVVDEVLEDRARKESRKKQAAEADEVAKAAIAGDEPADEPAKADEKPSAFAEKARRLQEILNKRDEQNRERQSAAKEMAAQRAAMERQAQEVAAERARIQQERAYIELLKKDPVRAIKESGLRPDEFLLSLTEEDTPDSRLRKQIQQQQEELQAMKRWREEQEQQRAEYERQSRMQMREQHRDTVLGQFTKMALDPDASPHLSAMYEDDVDALIFQGDKIAYQYRMEEGKEIPIEDIVLLLEYRAEQRYKRIEGKKSANKQLPPSEPKTAAKSQPSRTITAEVASERKTGSRKLSADSSDEERRAAAIRAVDELNKRNART